MVNSSAFFIQVSDKDVSNFIQNKDDYKDKVAFLGTSGKIVAQGNIYGANEVFIGSPDDAPETAKIIINITSEIPVEIYSKDQINSQFSEKISVVNMTETTTTISENKFYIWGEVTELDITLAEPADSTIYNEYMFQFTSGATATTLSLPATIKWVNDCTINKNTTYQISIVNNIGVVIAAN